MKTHIKMLTDKIQQSRSRQSRRPYKREDITIQAWANVPIVCNFFAPKRTNFPCG